MLHTSEKTHPGMLPQSQALESTSVDNLGRSYSERILRYMCYNTIDINVAINIDRIGLAVLNCPTVSSTGSNDCGEESAGYPPNLCLVDGETSFDEAVSKRRAYVSRFA
jgi:hypothetical protein